LTAFDKHLNTLEEPLVQGIEWEPQKVSASLVIGREEHKVWVAANEDLFQEADFLLPVALLPAMRAGVALKLPGRVSPRLLSSVQQIQDILNMWESIYKHIPVKAEARGTTAGRGSGVACFFGGGVDSFHTTLKHHEEISHLIFLHRRPTEDPSVAETDVRRAREVAEGLGKSLVEVDTNLHAFSDQTRIPWRFYHGMWIASTALLLQHKFRKVLIPGSTTSNYDNLRPQGTHPMLDPLWSTELVDFRHDGCEARRVDKAAYIASHEVAMRYLQVCDVTRGSHNCGHCKKCLRSMLNLKAAGALERCETLPNEIDPEAVRALDLSEYSESYFARENLRALERLGTEPELVRALEGALDRGGRIIAHSGYKEENLDAIGSKLQASRQRAEKLREKNSRLKAKRRSLAKKNSTLVRRNQELIAENAQLTARHSSLRYRLTDTAAQIVRRISGAAKLFEKRGPRAPS
jgi:hypothetical protein